MSAIKMVSFQLTDIINDLISSVGGLDTANGLTAAQLVALNPAQYKIEKTTYGEDRLVAVVFDQTNIACEAVNSGNAYTVYGENYELVPTGTNCSGVVGGHPTRPIERPR